MKRQLLSVIMLLCVLTLKAQNISYQDIKHWVGKGKDTSLILVDFKDGEEAVAFGHLFNDETTGEASLRAIQKEYPHFKVNFNGQFLNDIFYFDQKGEAGKPNYFSTFSKSKTTDWAYNSGLGTKVKNGDWYACVYNSFPTPTDSLPNNKVINKTPKAFSAEDIQYWVGQGKDTTLLIVDFKDGKDAVAFGYLFDGETTGENLLKSIQKEYQNFTVNFNGQFLNDIFYFDQKGEAGKPNYFSTFSKSKNTNWAYNSGLGTKVKNGDWYACVYNSYPTPNDSLPNLRISNKKPIPFSKQNIKHWTGQGKDTTLLVVDFKDGKDAIVFGHLFNNETTGENLLKAVQKEYPNFEVNFNGKFLNDIFYFDQKGEGGKPNYFSTFSKSNTTDWAYNSGLNTKVKNGDWYACVYNPYPTPNDSLPNKKVAHKTPNLFTQQSIQYWTGQGKDTTLLVVDFKDGKDAVVFGHLFDNETTGESILKTIQTEYPNFKVNFNGKFLNDIFYFDQKGEGGKPNYFSTFSKSKTTDWTYNSGLSAKVKNGDWYACVYNPYPTPNDSLPNVRMKNNPPSFNTSSGISKDDTKIINWANGIELVRGWKNIAEEKDGKVSFGIKENALGQVTDTSSVVSLGDAGYAILTFPKPITNGEGIDFAVFENGFSETFLELAFVEVSSDGKNFFRFSNTSLTPVDSQIGGFDPLDPKLIHNLAGKYKKGVGTGFDLEELKDVKGLDVTNITHVKIIDVVGSIDPKYAAYDSKGNIINDPYVTEFESGGFDLDGVAVLNEKDISSTTNSIQTSFMVYPTRTSDWVKIETPNTVETLVLMNTAGQIVKQYENIENDTHILLSDLPKGLYIFSSISEKGIQTQKIIIE